MTYTPGPWTVQESKTLLHIETRDSPVGDGVHVCSVPKAHAADADLIAAAPAMLAALEAECEWLAGARDGLLSVGDEFRARLAEERRHELVTLLTPLMQRRNGEKA